MPFEELEHTADVRIRVRGESIPHLFQEAARAMFQIMYGPCESRAISRTVTLESGDLESLLADFLSELLFVSEVDYIVFCSFDVVVDKFQIRAQAYGEPFDASKHAGREVKGISYSGLKIQREKDRYILDIIFDV